MGRRRQRSSQTTWLLDVLGGERSVCPPMDIRPASPSQRGDGHHSCDGEWTGADGGEASNYTLAPLTGLTANITPATLTVSAANASRTYGLPNPPLTASYSGFVNAEGTSVLAGDPSLITSATIDSPPGPYDITASAGTLSAANYSFAFVNGTLTVVAPPR